MNICMVVDGVALAILFYVIGYVGDSLANGILVGVVYTIGVLTSHCVAYKEGLDKGADIVREVHGLC